MMSRPLSALRSWLRYAWFTVTPFLRVKDSPRKALFPKAELLVDHYDPRESFNSIGGTVQMALMGGGVAILAQNLLRPSAPAAEITSTITATPFAANRELLPWETPLGGSDGDAGEDRPGISPPSDLNYSRLSESALAYLSSGDDNAVGSTPGTLPNAGATDPAEGDDNRGRGLGGDSSPGPSNVSGSGLNGVSGGGGTSSGPGGTTTPAPIPSDASNNSASLANFAKSPAVASGTGGSVKSGTTAQLKSADLPATGTSSNAALAPTTGTGSTGSGQSNPPTDATNIATNYAQLPLPFEMNVGQTDPQVVALSHGPGFGFFLTNSSAVLALTQPADPGQQQGMPPAEDVLALSFAGSSGPSQIVPSDQLTSRANYFVGNDPTQWHANVAQYGSVTEKNVYPGIDVVWSSAPGGRDLEYSFVVQPGADPSQIQVHIDGATNLSTDPQGDLLIGTASGTLLQTAPTLYQTGDNGLKLGVAGQAVLLGNGDLGFQVSGNFDPTKPLVIDPTIPYASYIGGSGTDMAYAVAADGAGDAYLTGSTASSNFPTTTGVYQPSLLGSQETFVTKLNAAGSQVIYSTYLGSSSSSTGDQGNGIAVDAAGNAYVVGDTAATNFPTTPTAFETSPGSTGAPYAYAVELDATGDALLYGTYIGGASTTANAVAVDPIGQAYITGSVGSGGSSAFHTTFGAYQTSFGGGSSDAYELKLAPMGITDLYATFLGGSGADVGYGIAVTEYGQAAVVGATFSNNFPTLAAVQGTHIMPGSVGFITSLNPVGQATFSTYWGGSGGGDQANAVAIDAAGNIDVTGQTNSTNFPTSTGAYQSSLAGGSGTDAFVSQLMFNGVKAYSSYLGGSGTDIGAGISAGSDGYVYVTGSTSSSGSGSFPTTSGALQTSLAGGTDAFVTRLDPVAGLAYSSYLGGSSTDAGTGVAEDVFNDAYVAGYTASSNFPIAGTPYMGSSGGGTDAFAVKVLPVPSPPVFTGISPDTGSSSSDQITSNQNLTLSGTATASSTVTVSLSGVGVIGTATAGGTGSWSFNYSGTTLPAGNYTFTATDTVGTLTSVPTSAYPVTILVGGPTVTLTVPSTTTSLSPVIHITASEGTTPLPDGTSVSIDVDLNDNGNFTDPGETGYATGTLSGGTATVVLPSLGSAGTYPIRARIYDLANNLGTSSIGTITVTSASSWTYSSTVLSSDPMDGSPPEQLGDVQLSQPVDLTSSPNSSSTSGLYYNSDSVAQEPIVQATLQSPSGTALPSTISAQLTFNGSATATMTYSTTGLNPGDPLVIAIQAPSAITTTGRYGYSLVISVPGQTAQTLTGATYVVAQDSSPFGAGWNFDFDNRLYTFSADANGPAGALIASGTGGWRFYTSAGGGAYTSPSSDDGTLATSGSGWTYTRPDGTVFTYNSSGYLTQVTSPDGLEVTTYTYDGSGDPLTATAVDSTVTTFNYSSGKVSTIVSDGRTTTLAYSGSNLTSITNPDGGLHTFSYDGNHRATGETFGGLQNEFAYGSSGALATMTWGGASSLSATAVAPAVVQGLSAAARGPVSATETDALGDVSSWQLDGLGRQLQPVDPDGGTQTDALNSGGYLTTATDQLGRVTTYALDSAGYPTQVTNPDGSTESYAYQSAFHALTQVTDARGNVTTYQYDASGHETLMIDPLGDRTTYAYSSAGLLTAVTDPDNHTTTYAYDSKRRVTTMTDALNDVTTYGYDANGNLQTATDALGNTTTTLYDAMGRPTGSIDALGNRTTTTYDAAGLQLTSINQLGVKTSTVYDGTGRGLAAESIQAVGTAAQSDTLTSYDATGQMIQSRNADGWTTTYAYSRAGQQTASTDPLGGQSKSSLDLAGQSKAAQNPLGQAPASAFNLVGQVTSMTDALGNLSTMGYDAAGNQTKSVDSLGRVTTTLYDALNRATTSIDGLGNVTTTLYDPAGNMTATVAPNGGVTTYLYDVLNSQTGMIDPAGVRTTTLYDKVGNVTSQTDGAGNLTTYLYDALYRQTGMIDAAGDRTTTLYDAAGDATSATDGRGDLTTTAYDALRQATLTTDATAQKTQTVFDANGLPVASVDPQSNVSKTVLDALGRAVATVDPAGKVTQTQFDQAGNTSASKDALGNATQSVTDSDGRVTQSVDALGNVTTTLYDSSGQMTTSIDPLGGRTTYAYDGAGRQTSVTDPLNHTTTTIYDNSGNVLATIDPDGNRTTYGYDSANRQTSVEDPLGDVTTTIYDSAGRVQATVDARGDRTTYAYDSLGRQTTVTDALGDVSTTLYDSAGNVAVSIDARGDRTTYGYDADNRQTSVQSPSGGIVTTVYDSLGQVTATIDQLNHTTTYAYNSLGQQTAVTDPLNHTTTTMYNANGQATSVTDPLNRSTTYAFDGLNRQTAVTNPLGDVTTTLFDALGRQTSEIDSDGNITTFAYDAASELTKQTDPLNHSTTFAYDAAGRKTATTDALGRVTNFTYDGDGRETGETWYSSLGGTLTNTLTFTYDAAGNQLTSADSAGVYTYAYDALNRVTSVQEPFGLALTYAYDAVSNRTTVSDSFGSVTTSVYDTSNRLTTREFGGVGQTPLRIDQTYTLTNMVSTQTRYSDLAGTTKIGSTTYTYNAASQNTNLEHFNGSGTALGNYTYTYDVAGEVATQTVNGVTTTYTYDADSELTADGTTTYTYDATGNRNSGSNTVGSDNQITSDGTWTYTYDAEGDLIEKSKGASAETWTYTYDNRNEMASATDSATPGGTVLQQFAYTYDADGHRLSVTQTVSGVATVTRFGYDGQNIWADLNSSNGLVTRREYLDGSDRVFARVSASGTASWYLPDRQGSIMALTDDTGTVIDTMSYSGFGVLTSESTPANGDGYKYDGYRLESGTNLYRVGARDLDPLTMRWTTPDPLGLTPDTNWYRYVHNDSTNATDPSGQEAVMPPLYMPANGNRPVAEDVQQRNVIDCYFLSVLAWLAENRPSAIRDVIIGRGPIYSVFFPGKTGYSGPIPFTTEAAKYSVHADHGGWVPLLEKAYLAKYDTTFGDTPRLGKFIPVMTGHSSTFHNLSLSTQGGVRDYLKNALCVGDKKIVIASTFSLNNSVANWLKDKGKETLSPALWGAGYVYPQGTFASNGGFVANHVYAVLNYDVERDEVELYNPHGSRMTVSFSKFYEYFNYMAVED